MSDKQTIRTTRINAGYGANTYHEVICYSGGQGYVKLAYQANGQITYRAMREAIEAIDAMAKENFDEDKPPPLKRDEYPTNVTSIKKDD